ncbi:UDP-2,4-diacetamido-2,4,6-trideoxy-beta-L-altropyranose hydrolase [Pseudomonas nitroreducens]|uniref:UDP-2,4-diacetamido-2,4, 6-trideoxy-beta-L-altropyranose hydrolase n=1 Tax=Pseudomonas nitroreducens TaxID=46680 RepID=UPI0014757A45|nr:UDP-2,4-diacetamido-2,4,6-trideoxy-beta-L-altropyranose hydrolase [Pseudomonas nitroreducens]MDG9857154.1 UDP-2,4-diacetamido-2,4,6-trideoxy-beta-L-altropyranose hydrolase [Pseudomonas nitroreducens]MDH1074307.1 UDP-2,4-diacetamido-2,4,6-trideoxy-beta-L-altropyranose hydrolase [Pseudomonas nitroreducens]NMZ72920.1 UDP-2,4-diacetamido-2,4,6-trideoxy-beta-L-altropyranose hydrolase [Pseudomonas nitroreducens]
MNIVFRVDASLNMGTGHLMRCLTLADALKTAGHQCHFVCREHPGNMNSTVLQKGHTLSVLPAPSIQQHVATALPAHAGWLGASWQEDAQQTQHHLSAGQPVDWLIVDHYALDLRWESQLAAHCKKLMVIDDLADRDHACHVLLDQSQGRQEEDYSAKVPKGCLQLLGPQFALLRPEFALMRKQSLLRRKHPHIHNLLITMGGIDAHNATGQVLAALQALAQSHWNIQVIMGATAPWCEAVKTVAHAMPCPTSVLINTPRMAQLMSEADIAIGAAGSTSWERCCLGLPSLMLILADNQREVAHQLKAVGAATVIESVDQIAAQLPGEFERMCSSSKLRQMSEAAKNITDGRGAERVVNLLRR